MTIMGTHTLVLAAATLSAACALSACETHDGTHGAQGRPRRPAGWHRQRVEEHRAGKSQSWKEACVFAKAAKSVQIELTPMETSGDGWYRTAIFAGSVQ